MAARELMDTGRRELIAVVRDAQKAGLTQREIAKVVGCSQPEVNRLLRFQGTSPNGRILRKKRREVTEYLRSEGCFAPRVFGSTARGEDGEESDIDLLASSKNPIGLLSQSRIEAQLTDMLGVKVDFVLQDTLRPDFADRILAEAVPL